MGSPVSRLSSIFGNSAIFEVMYVSIFPSYSGGASLERVAHIELRVRGWFHQTTSEPAVDVYTHARKDLVMTSDATFKEH